MTKKASAASLQQGENLNKKIETNFFITFNNNKKSQIVSSQQWCAKAAQTAELLERLHPAHRWLTSTLPSSKCAPCKASSSS